MFESATLKNLPVHIKKYLDSLPNSPDACGRKPYPERNVADSKISGNPCGRSLILVEACSKFPYSALLSLVYVPFGFKVLSIMPKVPEIFGWKSNGRSVSISSDRNIRDHLWRLSTNFGRSVPTENLPFHF